MCGICGKLAISEEGQFTYDMLTTMRDTLYRRGPDDNGIYIDEENQIGLCHRRLSIIDIEASKQPLCNEDGTIWIVYNGEIYNFMELRDDLIKKGHFFKTKGDTEVIVHLYEQYGENCVSKLRGMFAFAIWDNQKKELFVARDRVGIKPLHYFIDRNTFVFGSEIKAILADNYYKKQKKINIEAFHYYFSSLYVPAPLTIFEGIYKLLPAHYLKVDKRGKMTITQYWDVHFDSAFQILREEEYCEQLESLINESVRIRLISDVPLGAFLSGGMDSSTVVAMMSLINQSPVKTFSIGFSSEKYNESDDARIVARHFGTDHTEVILEPKDIIGNIRTLIEYFDEPFADSSLLPTYLVSKLASEKVKVALSGDGGDELFGGYHWWQNRPLYQLKMSLLPQPIRSAISKMSKLLPDRMRGKHFLSKMHMPYERYLLECKAVYDEKWRDYIYSDAIKGDLGAFDPYHYHLLYLKKAEDQEWADRIMEHDLKTYIPNDIQTKVDRMSMFCSLEARVPLLDHKLIEFSAKIPSKIIFKNNIPKYILKKTMEKYLPEDILYKKKQGFAIPLEEWLKDDLKELAYDMIFSSNVRPFFNMRNIEKMMQDFNNGHDKHKHRVWILFTFGVWHALHFG